MVDRHIFILGISAYYHDSAACLLKDGDIIAAAQEERFTRKKHDASFPRNAVDYCLKEAGITISDVSFVGFYEKPFLKLERLLFTYLSCAPAGLGSFLKAMPVWLKERIFLKDLLAQELSYNGKIIFPEHHESHAAAAFFPSPFNRAAILTMDGVGEWTTTSFGVGNGNSIALEEELRFPHSLGLLYSAFTYYCGFRVNSGEYKLMGLAPYGEPKYADIIRHKIVDIKLDGSFRLDMRYFNYCAGLTMTSSRFHALFGRPPRTPETDITQLDMDIASSVQEVTEEIMVKTATHIHAVTGEKDLCLAGGVALNCVGNSKVLRRSGFENVWIQPAAGDAGCALGAAMFIWHQYLGHPRVVDGRDDRQKGSFLGPSCQDDQVEQFLNQLGVPFKRFPGDALFTSIAELVTEGNVVGLVHGRMEFGPRALGARSIIGDPRSVRMQAEMNRRIKFRESFRPFAPSVLADKASDLFDLPQESPYMLLVAHLREDQIDKASLQDVSRGFDRLNVRRSTVPAVTHVDYSARLQTVDRARAPFFYQVIEAFYMKTGCPALINTSFNIRGEPIVCTLEDAYRCFMCTDMDALVLGHCLLLKTDQPDKEKFNKGMIAQVLD